MSDTTVATGLTVQNWDDKFFTEYLGESRFKNEMGTGSSSMIQVKEDLTKKKGDSITFALVNKLTGAGVTGSSSLEGSEEDMDSRSHKLTVDKLRNGVRVAEIDEQFSAISLRNAAKDVLKDWIMEKTRDDIITAMGSINGVAYGSASETQKDVWLVDNADRVLFGIAKSNNAANDHSACLGELDNTNDQLTPLAISLMKRIASSASPRIRPIRTKGDEQWYILYVNSLSFRDLAGHATMTQANRDALARGKDNPLFTGGDLIWDGVIIKEVPEISVYGSGAGAIDVAPAFFCGAQAVGIGWAKRTKTVTETFDYGDKRGVAVEEIRGVQKLTFGSSSSTDTGDLKDHGIVTGWFASVADS